MDGSHPPTCSQRMWVTPRRCLGEWALFASMASGIWKDEYTMEYEAKGACVRVLERFPSEVIYLQNEFKQISNEWRWFECGHLFLRRHRRLFPLPGHPTPPLTSSPSSLGENRSSLFSFTCFNSSGAVFVITGKYETVLAKTENATLCKIWFFYV